MTTDPQHFHQGDQVRCINTVGTRLSAVDKYTVSSATPSRVFLVGHPNPGKALGWYSPTRFALIEGPQPVKGSWTRREILDALDAAKVQRSRRAEVLDTLGIDDVKDVLVTLRVQIPDDDTGGATWVKDLFDRARADGIWCVDLKAVPHEPFFRGPTLEHLQGKVAE